VRGTSRRGFFFFWWIDSGLRNRSLRALAGSVLPFPARDFCLQLLIIWHELRKASTKIVQSLMYKWIVYNSICRGEFDLPIALRSGKDVAFGVLLKIKKWS